MDFASPKTPSPAGFLGVVGRRWGALDQAVREDLIREIAMEQELQSQRNYATPPPPPSRAQVAILHAELST